MNQMVAALQPICIAAVTPIGWYRGDTATQWATGTFFQVAERKFLVTAAHIWLHNGEELDLCAFELGERAPGETRMRDVPLNGHLLRAQEPADISVLELTNETANRLANRRFLRLHDVELRASRPGWCFVYGFPSELAADDTSTATYRFNRITLGASVVDTDSSLENLHPNYHFLLDAARQEIYYPDGRLAELPYSLGGMSGGSVWQTLRPGQQGDWRPDYIRIVGVQVGYYRKQSLIKCVHWGAVAACLYQQYPDLRAAITMHLGPPN
jgi:hypothetical protein